MFIEAQFIMPESNYPFHTPAQLNS